PERKDSCRLVDRTTHQPPKDRIEFWQKGELDVTGRISPAPGSDSDYSQARDDALRLAKLRCAERAACEGSRTDCFCVMDVEVLENRSGFLESRQVDVPESPYGGPAHK